MKTFIVDVDGVLTNGQFVYTREGKLSKTFGADDHDALRLLNAHMQIHVISGDTRGFEITKKRVAEDMHLPLDLVSTSKRLDWIASRFSLADTIYMGDGIFDAMVFAKVGYAIAPNNAFFKIKPYAHYITQAKGGEGAVAEACWHIIETFFQSPNILDLRL